MLRHRANVMFVNETGPVQTIKLVYLNKRISVQPRAIVMRNGDVEDVLSPDVSYTAEGAYDYDTWKHLSAV